MSSSKLIPVESLETTPNGSSDSRGEEQVERTKKRVIEPDQFGFHILREPTDPEDIEVDVIAIHGIAATPKYTWVDKESQVNWLRDSNMLPAVLPNARIMTYNYESVWHGDNAVKQSLDDVAKSLLNALNVRRSECPHRPILFIGHCFGGLVSLKCYITAKMFPGEYPGTFDSVAGMMFLGTPFQGIASDSGLTTMGEVYLAIVKSKVEIQDNLMTTIAHDNDTLVDTVSSFSRLLETSQKPVKPKIFCFFERKSSEIAKKVAKVSGERKFLVTRSSGTLPPHDHEGLALDHFSINKFVGENDDSYTKVSREIKKMNDNAMELIEARRSGLPSLEETKIARLSPTPKYPRQSGQSRAGPILKEENFANRDNIINKIEEGLQKTTCVALYGDSGNGKTHVAVEYAHKSSQDSHRHVYWVNAGSVAEFELSYKSIAKTLGINRDGMANDDVLEEVYKTLTQDTSGRWLMVVDGWDNELTLKATSASRPEKSLLDYIPRPNLARVLVTTRSKKMARRIVGPNPQYTIKVSQLKDGDASLLLLGKDTKDPRARRKAAARAKELGGSAGTLVLAHLYQKEAPGEPKANMEKILDGQTKDTSNTMRVWRLLYELMIEKNNEAAELLLVMGSMNVQCIPNSFFERDQLYKQMKPLGLYGMVEPSADSMVTIVTATIRECVQKYLDEEKERDIVEEQVLSVMCNKFHGDEHRTAEVLLPCALVALKFQPASTSADIKYKLASLHSEVAKLYRHTKQDQLAINHWEQVISLCQEGHENNHKLAQGAKEALEEVRTQLESAETNSKAMVKTGYIKSRVARNEQELLEWERSAGEHHPETMRKRGEIATLQLMHGGESEAQSSIEKYQRVLEWYQDKQGNNSIDVARQRNNLALALQRQGEYGKAENHYTSAIVIANSHLGQDSPELLRIHSNLASMYCKQGRLHEAEQTLRTTLQRQQKALGANHPDTLKTRQNMASLMGDKGQVDAAVEALEEVFRIQVELLGPKNPDTLKTACSLAIHLSMQGHHKKAESMLKETLQYQTKLLGEAHPDTTATKRNLKELSDQMEMVRV